MRSSIRILLCAIVFVLGCTLHVGSASAATFSDAITAYKSGDYETARRDLLPLAVSGDREAQYILGEMYESGKGGSQDYGEAVKWLRLSAKQGEDAAQFSLGMRYYDGQGVSQDYLWAYIWLDLADQLGTHQGSEYADYASAHLTAAQLQQAYELEKQCTASNYTQCGE